MPAAARRDRSRPRRRDRHRHRLHLLHDAARQPRTGPRSAYSTTSAAAARVGKALEAPRGAAGGGPDQRCRASSGASRGCDATAARSRRSGSSPRRCRSSLRRPRSSTRAERLIEAADWVVWQLTGSRRATAAPRATRRCGRSATAFRPTRYFAALDPRFEHVIDEKMSRQIVPIGARAGDLTARPAAWTGLRPGTAVAVANVDAHVSVPAATVTEPGTMVVDHGHEQLSHPPGRRAGNWSRGCAASSRTESFPASSASRPGSPAVGDIFAWFTENAVPPEYHEIADGAAEPTCTRSSRRRRRSCCPERAGSWHSTGGTATGRCSSTPISGASSSALTLATRAPELYRALIEATAFGTRVIIEAFESAGVPVTGIVACGGLPERNKLLMQIYADVTGREFTVAASRQAPALGSAMFGAVAAGAALGGYDSIVDASRHMAHLGDETYRPIAAAPRGVRGALPRVCPAPRPVRTRRRRCDEESQEHPAAGVRGRTAHVVRVDPATGTTTDRTGATRSTSVGTPRRSNAGSGGERRSVTSRHSTQRRSRSLSSSTNGCIVTRAARSRRPPATPSRTRGQAGRRGAVRRSFARRRGPSTARSRRVFNHDVLSEAGEKGLEIALVPPAHLPRHGIVRVFGHGHTILPRHRRASRTQ